MIYFFNSNDLFKFLWICWFFWSKLSFFIHSSLSGQCDCNFDFLKLALSLYSMWSVYSACNSSSRFTLINYIHIKINMEKFRKNCDLDYCLIYPFKCFQMNVYDFLCKYYWVTLKSWEKLDMIFTNVNGF